jgi:hypothetical protein
MKHLKNFEDYHPGLTDYAYNQLLQRDKPEPDMANKMADSNDQIVRKNSHERWELFSNAIKLSNTEEDLESRLRFIGFSDNFINICKDLYRK